MDRACTGEGLPKVRKAGHAKFPNHIAEPHAVSGEFPKVPTVNPTAEICETTRGFPRNSSFSRGSGQGGIRHCLQSSRWKFEEVMPFRFRAPFVLTQSELRAQPKTSPFSAAGTHWGQCSHRELLTQPPEGLKAPQRRVF